MLVGDTPPIVHCETPFNILIYSLVISHVWVMYFAHTHPHYVINPLLLP